MARAAQPGAPGIYPAQLSAVDAQRVAGYRTYLDFYNGYQWEGLPAPNERRLTFNYARVVVNKASSYLMGKGVSFAVDPPADSGDEGRAVAQHAEALLMACMERNSLALADLDTAVDSAVLGDGAFKVTWDPQAGAPTVTAVDPATLVCERQGDDYRRLLRVRQAYAVDSGQWTVDSTGTANELSTVHRPLSTVVEDWTPDTLEVWRDGVLETRVPNPYGFIPYVVFPNLRVPKEPWGQSDLVDVMGVNRDLNARLSVLSHILEVSGNPIAVLENVTDSTGIKVGPGRLWELPKDARAYLLDLLSGGGVQLHIEYINLLYRAMHDLAEMPRTAFGDGSGTSKSGVALEIEMQPPFAEGSQEARDLDGGARRAEPYGAASTCTARRPGSSRSSRSYGWLHFARGLAPYPPIRPLRTGRPGNSVGARGHPLPPPRPRYVRRRRLGS